MDKDGTQKTKGEELIDFYSDESQILGHKSEWYDKIASSVTKCPFCDLKEKYLVAQEGDVVLTMNLFPYIDGHLMVIPREHIEKVADFSGEDWQAVHNLISLGIDLLKEAFKIQDVNVLYREGSSTSGSSLKHVHIHLLPVTPDFMTYDGKAFKYNLQDITVPPVKMAERLRKVCKTLKKSK